MTTTDRYNTTIKELSTTQGLSRRTDLGVALVAPHIADAGEETKKDSVEVDFSGEPFADNGDLLSSLSPLLFSVKLFGLHFHREDQHQRPTNDAEWNPSRPTAKSTACSKLRVYATFVLILIWLNTVRFAFVFTASDYLGAILVLKIASFNWCVLVSIFQTTCYYASHTGQLVKVLSTLLVTREFVRGARRAARRLTAFIWTVFILDVAGGAYAYFNSGEEYNFILAPFVTYIDLPPEKLQIAKMIAYIVHIIVLPTFLFAHSMSLMLVYIFHTQFEEVNINFCRALGERGQFNGNLSLFRRRHQMLSRAVNKVDRFMRLSNVAGFVFHIVNIILLLYSIIFYPESTKTFSSTVSYVFWMVVNIIGLLISASAGVIVNHVVCMVFSL